MMEMHAFKVIIYAEVEKSPKKVLSLGGRKLYFVLHYFSQQIVFVFLATR